MTPKRKTRPAPEPMAEGSARIDSAIQEQQRLLAAAIASLEAAGVEDVHRGRVAARRLRSLLKTYRPLLDARRARLYRIDLRSFARSLGAVREADVRKDLLMTLVRGDAAIQDLLVRFFHRAEQRQSRGEAGRVRKQGNPAGAGPPEILASPA